MHPPAHLRTVILALLVAFLWGSSFVLTKIVLRDFGPLTTALYRWFIASAALLALLPALGQVASARQALREGFLAYAVLGFVGISLYYALQNIALHYTTAVHAGILINVCTVFIAILGVVWLRERIGLSAVLGMALALLGATLVSLPQRGLNLQPGYLRGDVMTVAAAFCAAVYTVYGKRVLERHPPVVVTTLAAVFGTVFLVPLAILEGLALPVQPVVWAALLVLGLGSGALANLWWLQVLEHMDAARAGVFLLAIPVVSTLLAVVWLREPFPSTALAGTVMVLVGVLLTQRHNSAEG